jgi:hypothetical protein
MHQQRLQLFTGHMLNIIEDEVDPWEIALECPGGIAVVVQSKDDVHTSVEKAPAGPTAS